LLRIVIATSPLFAVLLVIVHLIAGACAFIFLPAWWAAAILTAAPRASLVFHLRRDALRLSGDAVIEVTARPRTLPTADPRWCTARRHGSGLVFVPGSFTAVNVRLNGGRKLRLLAVMPDSAPAEERHRLRVWLRYRAHPKCALHPPCNTVSRATGSCWG
jgi:hypothetical protein